MSVWYNDHDSFLCAWLLELMWAGRIPDGDVDGRSIVDVSPPVADQCHFFAGIGGWAHALELAGWGGRPVWTASLPCQPFSVAGKGLKAADERHLWPAFFALVAERRPPVIFGEQVAGRNGCEWFSGIRADLEGAAYVCGAAIMPACAVGAPHRRERLFWVAVADAERTAEQRRQREFSAQEGAEAGGRDNRHWGAGGFGRREGERLAQLRGLGGPSGGVADRHGADGGFDGADGGMEFSHGARPAYAGEGDARRRVNGEGESDHRASGGASSVGDAGGEGLSLSERQDLRGAGRRGEGRATAEPGGSFWDDAEWRVGADGKARRAQPGIRLLVDGFPNRVGALRGFGNAIVPQIAAKFIRAVMEE